MKRALRLPLAILTVLFFGIVTAVLFRAGADSQPTGIVLKWNPPAAGKGPPATGYRVYRSQPDGTFLPIASVTAPTYVDRAIMSGSDYTYFVTALDAAGHESPASNYVSVVP